MQSKINSLFSLGLNQYINSDLKEVIVDPDPELMYTKRKIASKETKGSKESVPGTSNTSTDSQRHEKVNYPASGWGISLKKMPFFSRAEMDKYVERTG